MEWTTIESDPGVFTELARGIGVKDVQVEEVYSLDDQQLLDSLGNIYGLIFLFKWDKKIEQKDSLTYYDQDLFFATQEIKDACGTYALLSVLLNNNKIDIGEELREFKSFTKDLDCNMKGLALSNQDHIKEVHNSFAKRQPFFVEEDKKQKGGDAFHFVSYVPFKGKVYELDGLQQGKTYISIFKGPIQHGNYEKDEDWIQVAKQEINLRIQKYAESEVRFNLLAVVQDQKNNAEQQIEQADKTRLALYSAMATQNLNLDGNMKEDQQQLTKKYPNTDLSSQVVKQDGDLAYYIDQLQQQNNVVSIQQQRIEEYLITREDQRKENQRRKHDYFPFIIELLKLTAKKGKLEDLVENAKKKKKEKDEKSKQNDKMEVEK